MSATMPPTTPPATPPAPDPGRPRAGAPRWAWVLIAVLAAVALVAVTIAVTDRDSDDNRAAVPPPAPAAQAADGCLGVGFGLTELVDLGFALENAQLQAPLTTEGAAAFTAALARWAFSSPPGDKASTAEQILTKDASDAAQKVTRPVDPQGTTSRVDFSDGRYYVESFNGAVAVVSYAASAFVTKDGQDLGEAIIGGTAHLKAVDGAWRFADLSLARPLEEIQRLGTRYAGGC